MKRLCAPRVVCVAQSNRLNKIKYFSTRLMGNSDGLVKRRRLLKGIIHSKLRFHSFAAHPYVLIHVTIQKLVAMYTRKT